MRITQLLHPQGTIERLGRGITTVSTPDLPITRSRSTNRLTGITPARVHYSTDSDSVENWVTSPRLLAPDRKSSRRTAEMSDQGSVGEGGQKSMLARQREKEEGKQPAKAGWFPQSYSESISQWVRQPKAGMHGFEEHG